MKRDKVKLSVVAYSNTLPFIYGFNQSTIINEIDLQLDIPSNCAKKLLNNEVDLGLVPIAILPQLNQHYILSDYCIGAVGKVNSVLLLSDVPLQRIKEIQLDYQSKTSINLVQVLAKKYWNISPDFIPSKLGYENKINDQVAGLIIGDRTFKLKKKYNYQYDLSEEWYKYTGLPFVFACWVSNKKLPDEFVKKFNEALKLGVNNIDKSIENYKNDFITKQKMKSYLSDNIDYLLNPDKLKAIELFNQYVDETIGLKVAEVKK